MTDTAPRATTRSRENTRQRLLDAAALVFAELGLDGASVEEICERAGFTRGAFYSNFESKEELFLELTARVAEAKLQAVTERVRELEAAGYESLEPGEIVQRVLDVSIDERMGILLMSEIRTHAMRDSELAAPYLAWEQGMIEGVAAIVSDITRVSGLRLRLPAEDVARLLIAIWETTCGLGTMQGLDHDTMRALVGERTGALALALLDS